MKTYYYFAAVRFATPSLSVAVPSRRSHTKISLIFKPPQFVSLNFLLHITSPSVITKFPTLRFPNSLPHFSIIQLTTFLRDSPSPSDPPKPLFQSPLSLSKRFLFRSFLHSLSIFCTVHGIEKFLDFRRIFMCVHVFCPNCIRL